MALIIRGKSRCHLCGQLLAPEDDVQLFPPALLEPSSDSAHLNDSGVHRVCYERLPEHDKIAAALENYLRQMRFQ